MTTLYVTHPLAETHHLPEHPEHAGRIRAVWRRIDESGLLAELDARDAEEATPDQILRVHDDAYLALLGKLSAQPHTLHLDSDTYFTPSSYTVARLAAGAAVQAVDAVLTGSADNALVAMRPPGHHAVRSRGMGFCLLNNVAVAAAHATAAHGLQRVAIVDYDVHHGNGTEAIFYDRPDVLFISTHQYPLYPMTGHADDTGAGPGDGFTVNIPMPAGCGDTAYARVFDDVVAPALRRYRPELLLVSAGFDAHWADPLAGMRLSLTGFAALNERLVALANELCGGRIAFLMEGGYYVEALAFGMVNIARQLLGHAPQDPLGQAPPRVEPDIARLIAEVCALHRLG